MSGLVIDERGKVTCTFDAATLAEGVEAVLEGVRAILAEGRDGIIRCVRPDGRVFIAAVSEVPEELPPS
jgi:hypothetical protein